MKPEQELSIEAMAQKLATSASKIFNSYEYIGEIPEWFLDYSQVKLDTLTEEEYEAIIRTYYAQSLQNLDDQS